MTIEQHNEGAALGLDIEEMPDYVRNGIVRLDTADGPIYMITERAKEWLMRGDNCANRELNAMLRERRGMRDDDRRGGDSGIREAVGR
jgi:hypothetical protein